MDLNALRLTHVIPSPGFYTYAVASLGDEVFVPAIIINTSRSMMQERLYISTTSQFLDLVHSPLV